MSNIIERLLGRADKLIEYGDDVTADLLREAANEIAALKSRIEIPAARKAKP